MTDTETALATIEARISAELELRLHRKLQPTPPIPVLAEALEELAGRRDIAPLRRWIEHYLVREWFEPADFDDPVEYYEWRTQHHAEILSDLEGLVTEYRHWQVGQ